ncbi:MAG: DUF2183 domain-containing protein, partial [Bdellovibrionales bacterium]|nr:DUF2183 domain-containing protein [Bdellovibrionales bacterium]
MSNITLRILIGSLLFLSLTGLTQEQSGYQDFILLSDLDDTLKITNHSGGVSRLYRALWSTKVFAGMERLYQQISDDSSDFYIVSASPKLIRSRVKRLLRKRGLNHAKVVLKKIRDGKTYNYKVGAIKHILSQTTGRLILVGDDTSHDPEVYDYIMQNYPDRVETIYIRTIVGRE